MSKRHQSSRRRAYGRRQHELRERPDRTQTDDVQGFGAQAGDADRGGPSFMDLDLAGRRLTFAVGD